MPGMQPVGVRYRVDLLHHCCEGRDWGPEETKVYSFSLPYPQRRLFHPVDRHSSYLFGLRKISRVLTKISSGLWGWEVNALPRGNFCTLGFHVVT